MTLVTVSPGGRRCYFPGTLLDNHPKSLQNFRLLVHADFKSKKGRGCIRPFLPWVVVDYLLVWAVAGAGAGNATRLLAAASFAWTGSIETTSYSLSLSSPSGTFSTMKSFFMRNMAFSPTGRSAGCFSSRGQMW